jgi:hypothetical protein
MTSSNIWFGPPAEPTPEIVREKVYYLRHPIEFREGDVERVFYDVTVRRPIAKDLLALDGESGEIAKSLAMIAQLTGLMMPLVHKLDNEDVQGISEIIAVFMAPGPQTGGTS